MGFWFWLRYGKQETIWDIGEEGVDGGEGKVARCIVGRWKVTDGGFDLVLENKTLLWRQGIIRVCG